MPGKYEWGSDEEIVKAVQQEGTVVGAARVLQVSNEALRSRIRRRQLEPQIQAARSGQAAHMSQVKSGEFVDAGQSREITSDDPAEWGDIDALLRSRGLDPAEWVVLRVRVNEWGENEDGEKLTQLRVDIEPMSKNSLLPARIEGWKPPPDARIQIQRDTELVAFFGDQHCPHHDKELHAATVEWLRTNQPDRGVLIGDLLDFDAVSRHRHNPEWATTMQESIDGAYNVLRAYVEASPGTRWSLLSGNHEERLRNSVIDHLLNLYGVRRATKDGEVGEAVLSISHLLRLDELGIEWIDPEGEYTHGQVKVSPYLAARHGWIARKGSGSSAIQTLDMLRYSCVIGHTHRQSIVFHTAHDIDGNPSVLLGCEAGTMAQLKGGLGYTPAPDWQQGFATAQMWPDGRFKLELAQFVEGSLLWRDQRIDT